MIRLNMIVEGQTEETFIRDILAPHLGMFGVFVYVRSVETGRTRNKIHRGGLKTYLKAKNDISAWLKQEKETYLTTMFDYYALPGDFPGRSEVRFDWDPFTKVRTIEKALALDIDNERFIPYIQLHEFEALLFSDIGKLSVFFPEKEREIHRIAQDVSDCESPEHINDGVATAPSKRIILRIPEFYDLKRIAGPTVAKTIGLNRIREKCHHFDAWLKQLEALRENDR